MTEPLTQRQALMALNSLGGVGPITVKRLLEIFQGDPAAALSAPRKRLMEVSGIGADMAESIQSWAQRFDLEKEESALRKSGARFIIQSDPDYPRLLKEIYDPPIGLYLIGKYNPKLPCVGIVGTRRPTLYGRSVARKLAADLGNMGFCVISGMARGIDSEAHEAVLAEKGATAAVLGNGPDIVYPPENGELRRALAESGAIISEFSFGRRADRQTFPRRNRIISGMCDALIVVESGLQGGSMITARFAAEHGRAVFAVPGRIDQPASRGCSQLIREGATLLMSAQDVVEELRYLQLDLGAIATDGAAPNALPNNLTETERAVAELFADGSIHHPDSIAHHAGIAQEEASASLMMLELKSVVAKRADGSYEKKL